MRKTVNVKEIVEAANEKLAGWSKTPEERQGIISMTQFILSTAGAYSGFNYLTEDELTQKAHDCAQYNLNESGTVIDLRPGVRHTEPRMQDGVDMWFKDTDETRVKFFLPNKWRA